MRICRSYLVALALSSTAMLVGGCGGKPGSGGDDIVDAAPPPDACEGIGCSIVDCGALGLLSTKVRGTVFAPNGTLPLFGVTVYVPFSDPGPLPAGVQCDHCTANLPGGSYARAVTDEAGHFMLQDVPATANVPLVIQVGKWRRQLVIDNVAACQDTVLPDASTTLPSNHTQGDMPQIAITTGSADALECLVRKLGIADSEITTDTQGGKIHLYSGNGANKFAVGFAGGTGNFSNATTLWGTVDKLAGYDIALFSCEGGQHVETKPLAALQAVHDYADRGGRLFLSHWHNIWVSGNKDDLDHGMADWQAVATFDFGAAQDEITQLTIIDETVPKGFSFAKWMENVGGSPVPDPPPSPQIHPIQVNEPRYTCQAVDPDKGERWVYVDPALSTPSGKTGVQDMLFTTPQNEPPASRCGKVVFSDMHVSSGSTSKAATAYPGGCSSTPLSAQEKALAFIFFDISSCVGGLE